jgi:aspartate racemase
MASFYVKALRDAHPDGPYVLGGYSMGGMVAFEMAQQLQAQGQKVSLLVIIDVPAQSPRLRYLSRFADQLGALRHMGADERLQLFLQLRHYLFRLRYVRRLNTQDKVTYVRRKLSGGAGSNVVELVPGHTEAQLSTVAPKYEDADPYALARRRIQSIHAVNDRAYRAYIPRPYHGSVAIIRSERGYTGDPDKDYSPDPQIGWGRIVSGDIPTYIVPGDHNQMIREPHVELLATHLRACLDAAQG